MMSYRTTRFLVPKIIYCMLFYLSILGCAPRVVQMSPLEGAPGALVSLSMEYLVGWPRVEIGGTMMDWPKLKLLSANPERKEVPGEELVWIEDKILQFTIPDLPPGNYVVTFYDDKGTTGATVYWFLYNVAFFIYT